MNKPQIAPRLAHTFIAGRSDRKRRVYDICKLEQPQKSGIAYHGCTNCANNGEPSFAIVGATSLESGLWYHLDISRLKEFIAEHENEASHE